MTEKPKDQVKELTAGARKAAADLQASVDGLQAALAASRGRVAQLQASLSDVDDALLPDEEIQSRVREFVRTVATAAIGEHGRGVVMEFGEYGAGVPEGSSAAWRRLSAVEILALGDPEGLERGLLALIEGTPHQSGLPAAARPARSAELAAALAAEETAEERLVDAAAAVGIKIAHRPEVQQRRDTAARQRELDALVIAARAERQAAIDRRMAEEAEAAAARGGRSYYIESGGRLMP